MHASMHHFIFMTQLQRKLYVFTRLKSRYLIDLGNENMSYHVAPLDDLGALRAIEPEQFLD